MSAGPPRVFSIAAGQPFLEVLADAVLTGFPLTGGAALSPFDLARWTILLPTRRAARELERIFLERSSGKAMLLPRIAPIGDIDEDVLGDEAQRPGADLPDAISPHGQLLLLIDLIDQWSRENPQTRLAQEIAGAPHQAHALALSLADFLDSAETEDVDVSRLPELYGLESARHRDAILEFLSVARESYPARLSKLGLCGAKARRSLVLRREAQRLTEAMPEAPIIAAGSTGSIPATRAFLRAISLLPNGAVILPGLDGGMDEASWSALGPPHPQYALKQLLDYFHLERQSVRPMPGPGNAARNWLASEIMRPAETSDSWRDAIAASRQTIAAGMAGIELAETRHIHEEATVIALILRQCLEQPGTTASLITPDRNLARRVKAALRRWNIAIDDSGGEPLIRSGGAALLGLLLDTVQKQFAPQALAALLRHDMCRFGETPDVARRNSTIIELALLRSDDSVPPLPHMADALRKLWPAGAASPLRHLVLQRIVRDDWDRAIVHAERLVDCMAGFADEPAAGLSAQLDRICAACDAMAGGEVWLGEAGMALLGVITGLKAEAHVLADCDFPRAAAILRHALTVTVLRPPGSQGLRLSILGLLEARLIRPDLVVLGGLNEGTWPGLPDAGPWLNRPMRDILGMQQPERDIGQTAHDFAQALGAPQVKLVWSRRIDDAPAIPSRWVLRLQMLLKAADLKDRLGAAHGWQHMARSLDEPASVTPHVKPQPRPPVAARPRRLSVTRVETLIRDPYAIYARFVLGLEPIGTIAAAADPARRGMIFHGAIGDFLLAYPLSLPGNAADELLRFGRLHFAALRDDPAVISFWWPRFQRITAWLVQEEIAARPGIQRVHAEVSGATELQIKGQAFTLTCRADRIDILNGGTARITDYKTGTVPSTKQVLAGLAPQLTLQACILAADGFRSVGRFDSSALVYVKLGGGDPAGELKPLKLDGDAMTVARQHLAGLVKLLTAYAGQRQAYQPRAMVEKEDEARDYDHLSRFREWALAGSVP